MVHKCIWQIELYHYQQIQFWNNYKYQYTQSGHQKSFRQTRFPIYMILKIRDIQGRVRLNKTYCAEL